MQYSDLRKINVNNHILSKNGLNYLSWAWALDQLLMLDSNASWEYGEPRLFGKTMMVFCSVKAFGRTRTAQLPVMDYYNRAIQNPDAYAVNTAMQRCLVKAISLHGVGLYLYAGEDFPEKTSWKEVAEDVSKDQNISQAKSTALRKKVPSKAIQTSLKITPTAGAMDAFTQEEKELLHLIGEKISRLTEAGELKEASDIINSLTNDEKVAVWSLLGSAVRSSLKRLKDT